MTFEKHIDIDISKQILTLLEDSNVLSSYAISTAKNGIGQQNGSECTPLGNHVVDSKIGENAKENSASRRDYPIAAQGDKRTQQG